MVTLTDRVGKVEEDVEDLTEEVRAHASSKLLHLGTIAGASGPVLVALIEALKYLLG